MKITISFNEILLLLGCLAIFAVLTVKADPITFELRSMQIDAPGFRESGSFRDASGKDWLVFAHTSSAAGFRIHTGHMDQADGSIGFFWAALMTTTAFSDPITVRWNADICSSGDCVNATFSGQLSYSVEGLRWSLPPGATTLTTASGTLIHLSFVTNAPNSNPLSTRDAAIVGRSGGSVLPNAPVPEPGCLLLLGSGLAMVARKLGKRR